MPAPEPAGGGADRVGVVPLPAVRARWSEPQGRRIRNGTLNMKRNRPWAIAFSPSGAVVREVGRGGRPAGPPGGFGANH